MTNLSIFGYPYWLCQLTITVIVVLWTVCGEPAPVANHVVRSARPGDLCNTRRDVVLVGFPNSNASYLQCQKQSVNGSVGMWSRISCPIGQEFSYSRQRCLFPMTESNPATDTEIFGNGRSSENGNTTTSTVATTKSGAKSYRKLSTIMPVLVKQQHRTPVIRRPTAASRPTVAPNRTFHTFMTTLAPQAHVDNYDPQNGLIPPPTDAVTIQPQPHHPVNTEAYLSTTVTDVHIPDQVISTEPTTLEYTTASNPYQHTDQPFTIPARQFVRVTVGTPRRRLPTTSTTSSTTTTATTSASTMPETAPVPLLPLAYGLLGYPCSSDIKCIDQNSVCLGNICQCAEGYVLQSNMYQHFCALFVIPTAAQPPEQPQPVTTTQALPVFVGVGQPCGNSPRGPYCHTMGAQCRQGTCRCPKGHIDQDNICTLSGPRPGQPCRIGDMCTGGSMCIGDKCTCKDGDIIHDGICVTDHRPRPGQSCHVQWAPEWGQCMGGSYCAMDTGLCTCPVNTVLLNMACVPKVVQLGHQCQSPQECMEGSQCINNVCHAVIQHTAPPPVIETDPTCPNGWLFLDFEQKRYCAPAMLRLGEMCLSPLQTCTGGSVCRQGTCTCPDNFTPLQDYCIPAPPPAPGQRRALGTTCMDSSQCAWAGGLCQDDHCVCPAGTNVMLGVCRQPELPYSVTAGGYCTAPVNCVPGLACVYGVCICLPGYDCEGFLAQASSPGASCAYSQHCIDGSSCTNGWCICAHTDMIVENGHCTYNINKSMRVDSTTLIPAPAHHKPQPPVIPVPPVIPAPPVQAPSVTYAYNTLQVVGAEGKKEIFRPAPILPGLIPNGLGEYARHSKTRT